MAAGELYSICPICNRFSFKRELGTVVQSRTPERVQNVWGYSPHTGIVEDLYKTGLLILSGHTPDPRIVCCKWGVPSASPLFLQPVSNRVRAFSKDILSEVSGLVEGMGSATTSEVCSLQAQAGLFYLMCTLQDGRVFCATATNNAVQLVGEPVPYFIRSLHSELDAYVRSPDDTRPTLCVFWGTVFQRLLKQPVCY